MNDAFYRVTLMATCKNSLRARYSKQVQAEVNFTTGNTKETHKYETIRAVMHVLLPRQLVPSSNVSVTLVFSDYDEQATGMDSQHGSYCDMTPESYGTLR
jgi:hypothetical protein